MYFVTYKTEDQGAPGYRLGLENAARQRLIDVRRAAEALGADAAPASMLELLEAGEAGVELSEQLLAAENLPESAYAPVNALVCAPIPRPPKNIFAIGLNYVRHNEEFTGSSKLPEHPIIFTKAPTTVIGPGEAIRLRPDLSTQIDYEGELGMVIGKGGRDIAPEDAEAHIFGYTILNDVTARDLQKRTGQWFMGKSLDTFCPMGPYIVHKSVVGWPVKLGVRTTVSGEVRQNSNTEHLYFDIPTLIAAVSAGVTLEPGDIIATGTPEGVGMGFDPPKFLQAGDTVEVAIDKLGVLENPVH